MVATAPEADAVACRSFNINLARPALALVGKVPVMSIWTDLLFLGGHIATPAGLAAVAATDHPADPDAETPAVAARAATPRPKPTPPRTPGLPIPPPRELERALPRPNKVSPNDLW